MIYTIGHSTHKREDFLAMSVGTYTTLLDTRSHPGSKWPWWNKEEARLWLPRHGIRYKWVPELGGWRHKHIHLHDDLLKYGVDISSYMGRGFPKQTIAKDTVPRQEPGWTNNGLRDYSYFTGLGEFLHAADELIELGAKEDVAIMCCECEWWRCHRSMISDYLAYRGVETYHIMPHMRQKDRVKYVAGAKIRPHSEVLGNRLERYEPPVRERWEIHAMLTRKQQQEALEDA
jgi:hypothetical protein